MIIITKTIKMTLKINFYIQLDVIIFQPFYPLFFFLTMNLKLSLVSTNYAACKNGW